MENNEPQIKLADGFELMFAHDLTTMVKRTATGLDVMVCLDDDSNYHVEFGQSKRHHSMIKIIAAMPFDGPKVFFTDYQTAIDFAQAAIVAANS